MRLKVSPKAAIERIDALVHEGAAMLTWFYDAYENLEKKMKKEEEDEEKEEEERMERIRQQPDEIPIVSHGITVGSVPNHAKIMQLAMPKPITTAFTMSRQTKVGWEGMKEIEKKYDEWDERTKVALQEIFTDFSPVYSFVNARGEWSSHPMDKLFEKYINLDRRLEAKVNTLIGFYNALSANIRSPLIYLKDQAKLCFYDLVCPLKADSNEAALCSFVFQSSIGEKIEMIDAYNHIFGEQAEPSAAEKDKIKNAVDGINRKTNKIFGFSILATDKSTISIRLPARVTQTFL